MKSPTKILTVDRPHHVRTRFGNFILKGESDVRFELMPDRTRLTQVLRARGILSAITARLYSPPAPTCTRSSLLAIFRG